MEVKTVGDLIAALSKLAEKHGKDLRVGFPFQGRVAAVTRVEQWNIYTGPLCSPGEPPKPVPYIHLFANDWVG